MIKATGIYAIYDDVVCINNKYYALRHVDNNSAPCGKCRFYTLAIDNICSFPNKDERKCKHLSGTYKGWNTWEYMEIPEKYIVEYENRN